MNRCKTANRGCPSELPPPSGLPPSGKPAEPDSNVYDCDAGYHHCMHCLVESWSPQKIDSRAYATSADPPQISPKLRLGQDELQEDSPLVAPGACGATPSAIFATLRSLQEHVGALFARVRAPQKLRTLISLKWDGPQKRETSICFEWDESPKRETA